MLGVFFLFLLLAIITSIVVDSIRYGISPTPSSQLAKEQILSSIPKETSGTIYELGSGWGTLAFPLAKAFSQCQVVAYEISLLPWMLSKIRGLFFWQSNLHIYREDFFSVPLKQASVVICYLYPGAMEKLKDKFDRELPEGAFVISHTFAIPHWIPVRVHKLNDLYHTPIYVYVKK
jgi:hypothetical protein